MAAARDRHCDAKKMTNSADTMKSAWEAARMDERAERDAAIAEEVDKIKRLAMELSSDDEGNKPWGVLSRVASFAVSVPTGTVAANVGSAPRKLSIR